MQITIFAQVLVFFIKLSAVVGGASPWKIPGVSGSAIYSAC